MIESICAIGFSGHRELPEPDRVAQKIAESLDDIGRKATSRLVGVCSVAIGADLIFIEACLKRNMPWMAILPMPAPMFFNKKDFPDEKDRLRAMALLETAAYVEVTDPVSDEDLKFDSDYRKAAFSDSGQRIVDYCDVFVAALRQSHDPLKPGGTGDILEYAKRRRCPVAIINPDNGHIEHHQWHAPLLSGFVPEFGSLPETPLRQEFLTANSSRELRTVVDYFSRLSAAARRNVPRLRSMSAAAAIFNGCVAVVTLALVLLPWWLRGTIGQVATGVVYVLSFLAVVTTVWFILGKPHKRAARYRLGAEICRSLMATWNLPETHRGIFRGLPAEYNEFVRTLLNLRHLEGSKLAQPTAGFQSAPEDWKEPISNYVDGRVDKQLGYYKDEQRKARRRLHFLKPLIAFFVLGHPVIEVCLAVARRNGQFPTGERAEHLKQLVAFFQVAFPAATTTLITVLTVREANRRQGRYGEMLVLLKENAERLKFAAHKKTACDVVIDNERALLAENIEWANIAKYPATG